MTNVPDFMPRCCPQGNMGVYWVVKDDHKSNGLGEFEDGWNGWDDFDGWGMTCDVPGFFPVNYCPWCGTQLAEPHSYKLDARIPVETAIAQSQEWLDEDIEERRKRTAELYND